MTNAKSMATRQAFGEALADLGELHPQIVVLDADLSKSTFSNLFAKRFPERFLEMGIAEANMIGTAAGLALSGFTPFACSFACFITGRFDQIKMSVAYSEAAVCLVGTHAGIGIGPDGYSQQSLEDIALMRTLPNMRVLQPADEIEAHQMMKMLATAQQPSYLRLTRQNLQLVHEQDYTFRLGVFSQLSAGDDAAIFATGGTVQHALEASKQLRAAGIAARVINASSIKPIDEACIIKAAREVKWLISVEDHSVCGGLGGAIAEVLCAHEPKKLLTLGIKGEFGESGSPEALYEKHGLDAAGIFKAVKEWVGAK